MSRLTVVAAAGLALAACGSPKDAEGWAKRAAGRSRLDEKLAALEEVRRAPGDKKRAVPHLVEILKDADAHPRAKGEAAVALGEIGDPAAIEPLVKTIQLQARETAVREANRHAADALGALRAKEAVPVLTALLASRDGYTQVAAVDALGRIGDPAAVDALVKVATGEGVEPFTVRKALLALGHIGDPKAGGTVLKMLFEERPPGVSYFPEAAFAAVQIGKPMAGPLLDLLEGRDTELARWAKEKRVLPGAVYAKSAQLLGDVGGAEAVPALVKKLGYQDPDPNVGMLVRVFAAESLGRLRAHEAVRPLGELVVKERDPDVRDRYCDALARIGDRGALPALRTAAQAGDWRLRHGPLSALSRLGGEEERAVVVAARTECGPSCPAPAEAALARMLARLDAAKACGDTACWAGKLADANAAVRDRAALEVGRAGAAANAAALGDAIVRQVDSDADLAARYHAVLALGWIASREKLGAAAGPIAVKLEEMIAADRGRALTAGVDEDALRLATRLRRAGR